ncbi:MAG TPA: chemotaxis protein CheW [Gemmatimonadales bacterium]|nr:chemotaxis protein CheW [Gemmatimonadales bacterium]
MTMTTDAAERTQYLTFQLAGEEFAFGILRVKEILEYDTITRVPNAPAAVRGVINLRGSVVPVVDLAQLFSVPATTVTKRTCIVIVEARVEGQDLVMGVLADAVSQVMDLAPDAIEPPPAFGSRVRVEYLVGMGKVDARKFVLILDIDRLLGDVAMPATAAAVPAVA